MLDKDHPVLFAFGQVFEYEIWVWKNQLITYCNQTDNSYYDYRGNEKALTGIVSKEDDKGIIMKRFVVFEFK